MAQDSWRTIVSGAMSGAANMALDEALFRSVQAGESPPVLRLYRWRPAAVTLGYGQRGKRQVNLSACRKLGIDVVRRLTGGRAVLHADEVTYAVIASEQEGLFSADILENYHRIALVLQHCLQQLGLTVAMVSGRHAPRGTSAAEQSACFTAPAYYELTCSGRKICGSAQKREGGCFLQHGSLPVDLDPQLLFAALNTESGADSEAAIHNLTRNVGWINRELASPVTLDQVEAQLLDAFACCLPVTFIASQPSARETLQAAALETRYASHAWTMKGERS